MLDFFISYNRADRAWAEWIDFQLRAAGYSTVTQAFDFRPGENFVVEMDRATRDTERTIAVLSPDYLSALYTHPEWAAAFARDPLGKQRLLVPIRVRECQLSGLLAQVVYLDLAGIDDPETAKTRLLEGLAEDARPRAEPPFPGAADAMVPVATAAPPPIPRGSTADLERASPTQSLFHRP